MDTAIHKRALILRLRQMEVRPVTFSEIVMCQPMMHGM